MPNGAATLVTVVHPPGHFVLASVLSELPYLMTARAVMRSRVLAIEATSLRHMVEREPLLASALMRSVSHEVRHMVRQVRDLKLRSATQRLGCYLLARVKGPRGQDGGLPPAVREGIAGGTDRLPAGKLVALIRGTSRVWRGDPRVPRHPPRHPAPEGCGGAGRAERSGGGVGLLSKKRKGRRFTAETQNVEDNAGASREAHWYLPSVSVSPW